MSDVIETSDSQIEAVDSTEAESSEIQEQIEEPIAEPTPSNRRTYKLKVDGQEYDEEVDFDNEAEIVRKLQMAKVSHKRMQEAAKQRQEAESVMNLIKSNPMEAMKRLGLNPREVTEAYLAAELEREMLTPEEIEARAMQAELQKYRDQEQTKKQQQEQQRQQQLQDKYAQDFQSSIMKALDTSGLPKSPRTVARMAEYWSVALENGYDPDPSDLVSMVRESYIQEQKELLGGFQDGDSLIKFLGDDIAGKIRKSDLKRVQQAKVVSKSPAQSKPKQEKQQLTWDEMQERIKQRIKG